MMPWLIAGEPITVARARADQVLDRVGLAARASSRVTLLSGGEQQRVALARALVTAPAMLLADEPTGNLDPHTANDMHNLLSGLARASGTAVVVVTHNRALAQRADRIVTLEDGVLRAAHAAEVLA